MSSGIRGGRRPHEYVESVVILLTAVSVLPAYALFGGFQQLQLDALTRDGLVQSAAQLQARYDLIQQDLRRWVPPDGQEWVDADRQYPDTWSLVLHPDTGMSRAEQPVPRGLVINRIVPATAGASVSARRLDPLQHMVWMATVGSADQQRRIALFDGSDEASGVRCSTFAGDRETCLVQMSDGTPIVLEDPLVGSGLLMRQDFEWKWSRILSVIAALIGVGLGTSFVARLLTQRLLGLSASYAQHRAKVEVKTCPFDATSFPSVWRGMGQPERLALYQITSGQLVNPRNQVAVQHLIDAGLVHLDPWPTLRWPELKPAILGSETGGSSNGGSRTPPREPGRRCASPSSFSSCS